MIHYWSPFQWYTTDPFSSDTLLVPFPLPHYRSPFLWHTTCPLSSDTLLVPFPLTHYCSPFLWYSPRIHQCLLANDTLLVPFPMIHHWSLYLWHTINIHFQWYVSSLYFLLDIDRHTPPLTWITWLWPIQKNIMILNLNLNS